LGIFSSLGFPEQKDTPHISDPHAAGEEPKILVKSEKPEQHVCVKLMIWLKVNQEKPEQLLCE